MDEEALVTILTEPKNALVKQYQKLFDLEDTELIFTDDALNAIASKAVLRKSGARGLRSIIENLLLDAMFEVPDLDDVTEVIVDKATVEDGEKPAYKRSKNKKKKSKTKASSLKEAEGSDKDKDGNDNGDDDVPEKEAS